MVGLASVLGRGTLRKGRRAGALSAWTGGNSPLTGETTMTWGALVWRVQNIPPPHYKKSRSTMAVPRLNPSIIYCPISRYINHWPLDKNGSAECKAKPTQTHCGVSISAPDKLTSRELRRLAKRFLFQARVSHEVRHRRAAAWLRRTGFCEVTHWIPWRRRGQVKSSGVHWRGEAQWREKWEPLLCHRPISRCAPLDEVT